MGGNHGFEVREGSGESCSPVERIGSLAGLQPAGRPARNYTLRAPCCAGGCGCGRASPLQRPPGLRPRHRHLAGRRGLRGPGDQVGGLWGILCFRSLLCCMCKRGAQVVLARQRRTPDMVIERAAQRLAWERDGAKGVLQSSWKNCWEKRGPGGTAWAGGRLHCRGTAGQARLSYNRQAPQLGQPPSSTLLPHARCPPQGARRLAAPAAPAARQRRAAVRPVHRLALQ